MVNCREWTGCPRSRRWRLRWTPATESLTLLDGPAVRLDRSATWRIVVGWRCRRLVDRAVRDARLTDAGWLRDRVEQRGASASDLARELGVGILEVHTALTAAGVVWTGRRPPTYPQLYVNGWLAEQFAAGGSVRSIAETVGCSASAVRHAADKLGVSRRRFAAPTFPQLHDPEWLRERYVAQGQTSQEIAALIGCTENSVLRALHAAGIPTRPGRPPRRFPELHDVRWVRRRYVTERATSAEIAAELGCSLATVTKALRRAQVPVRGNRRFPQLASRAWLRRAFVTDRLTVGQVAAEIGCRPATVRKALQRAGITPRRHYVASERRAANRRV